MEYAIAATKRLLKCPFHFGKERRVEAAFPPSELSLLGMDSMINVLSFVDGESMYNLGCTNSQYSLYQLLYL